MTVRLDSGRVVVVRTYSFRERACEEIDQRYKHSSFPRKRESVADGRLWIPAFERVKESDVSHYDGRSAEKMAQWETTTL